MERRIAGRPARRWPSIPQTGEILAMTSSPAYDPNEFATGIEPALWSRLVKRPATRR